MSSIPAIQSSLNGIQQGMNSLKRTSADIAIAPVTGADLTSAVVQLSVDKLQVQASAKALQTSYDTLGTLLDLKA